MSDEVVEPARDETTETQSASEKDWKAEYEALKSESRKWETRAKENSSAARRLQEIEDAQKTETERLQARAEAAEKAREELELRVLRAEVAAAKGLTSAQAKRLQGSTLDELEADADDLLSAFPAKAPSVGNPDAGPRDSSGPSYETMSLDELAKATRRR